MARQRGSVVEQHRASSTGIKQAMSHVLLDQFTSGLSCKNMVLVSTWLGQTNFVPRLYKMIPKNLMTYA